MDKVLSLLAQECGIDKRRQWRESSLDSGDKRRNWRESSVDSTVSTSGTADTRSLINGGIDEHGEPILIPKKEFFRYRDSRQGKPLPGHNEYMKGCLPFGLVRRATCPDLHAMCHDSPPGWKKHLSDRAHADKRESRVPLKVQINRQVTSRKKSLNPDAALKKSRVQMMKERYDSMSESDYDTEDEHEVEIALTPAIEGRSKSGHNLLNGGSDGESHPSDTLSSQTNGTDDRTGETTDESMSLSPTSPLHANTNSGPHLLPVPPNSNASNKLQVDTQHLLTTPSPQPTPLTPNSLAELGDSVCPLSLVQEACAEKLRRHHTHHHHQNGGLLNGLSKDSVSPLDDNDKSEIKLSIRLVIPPTRSTLKVVFNLKEARERRRKGRARAKAVNGGRRRDRSNSLPAAFSI